MTKYVVGFAFSADREHVALITKLRPRWQAGKLNGIGGHAEPDETAAAAQEREFLEETGVCIPKSEWKAYATLNGPDYTVRVFAAFTDAIYGVNSMTDEKVSIVAVAGFKEAGVYGPIANLNYLIPLALDDEQHGVPVFFYQPRVA